jgi:hypothetical protein
VSGTEDASSAEAEGAAGADGCTAVLLSVPREIAERLASFLTANGVAARIRPSAEMTPERLAEEYLKQSPAASRVGKLPLIGPLVRRSTGEGLSGVEISASDVLPVWDVLVRPDDLPAGIDTAAAPPAPPAATPAGKPKLNVPITTEGPPEMPAPGSPVVLCELPWEQAWALSRRLVEAGIPAAVMESEKPDREVPMQARVVPVGVRAEDVKRARSFVGTPPPVADDA